jgi:hypothetical protein
MCLHFPYSVSNRRSERGFAGKAAFAIVGIMRRVKLIYEGMNPEIQAMWKELDKDTIHTLKALSNVEPPSVGFFVPEQHPQQYFRSCTPIPVGRYAAFTSNKVKGAGNVNSQKLDLQPQKSDTNGTNPTN